MLKDDIYYMKRIGWTTLAYMNENESDTCQHEDNMKKTLIKVKASKSDNQKHENDTHKSEGVKKR